MNLGLVVITFVKCILFNIILPTGDVESDLYLMYQTLNFDVGDSSELEGCKSCYHKTEKEIYYPENDSKRNVCKICLYNPWFLCGGFSGFKKLKELKKGNQKCLNNETFSYNIRYEWRDGDCDEMNDICCISQTSDIMSENPIQKLDPKKLFFQCRQLTNELDLCNIAGKASRIHCEELFTSIQFDEQLDHRKKIVEKSSKNESIFFYPYARNNQTLVMKETNHSINDPDIECGLLFFRHNNKYNEQRQGKHYYSHHCNEDSCLTHLKGIHTYTTITDLNEWRKRTEHIQGVKVGGVTCRLLQIFGTSILIPVFLNLTFNIVLFVNDFRDQKANMFEVLPLMLLFYPQYKTIKFLTRFLFIHRDENLLKQHTEEHDRTVAPLEPFLESCLQVNISLAILFASEGFFPKDELGDTISNYNDINSALPLLTFILSLFSSSFGMTKFFLSGPIKFLPNDSAFDGLLSLPFISLFLINSMFGFRIVCMESAFFTSYIVQHMSSPTEPYETTEISPIISPEYRLLVYLAPCAIPFLINVVRLWHSTKGLWKYFLKYPQFIISPCFTPFMFEGYELTNQQRRCKLTIWKWGTIINAIYIGCIPQCILCITDYYKGVHDWPFIGNSVWKNNGTFNTQNFKFENNDALFKSEYGNTIFGIISSTLFLGLIILFFGSDTLFKEKGIYCRCLNILCCPCPKPCINVTEPDLEPSSSMDASEPIRTVQNVEEQSVGSNQTQIEIYLYSRSGERKFTLLGKSSGTDNQLKLVNLSNESDIVTKRFELDKRDKTKEKSCDVSDEGTNNFDDMELHEIEVLSGQAMIAINSVRGSRHLQMPPAGNKEGQPEENIVDGNDGSDETEKLKWNKVEIDVKENTEGNIERENSIRET